MRQLVGQSHEPTEEEHEQLVLQGARLNAFLTTLAVPGIALFGTVLWTHSPSGRLLLWTVVTCVLMTLASIHNLWVLVAAQGGEEQRIAEFALVTVPFESAALGAFSLIAMPADSAGQMMLLTMLVVAMSGNVVTRSLTRSVYYASQVPLVAATAIGYVVVDSSVSTVALFILAYCLVAGTVLARIVRSSTLQSLRIGNENAVLLADLHTSNHELQRQAETDALTGLLNRSGFVARLEQVLSGEQVDTREGDPTPEHIAVLFVDLNRFKAVNDSLGHAAGDELLKEAATRLRACVRPTDIVARIGGDELTIAAPGIQGDDAVGFAQRIADVFATPFEIGGTRRSISASIGVAYGSIDDFEVDDLLAGSDAALYAAKGSATSHIAVFDDEARSQAAADRQMRRDLIKAFDRNQIVAYWQPIVCTATGRLEGVEGLARWNDNGKIRPAGEFIDAIIQAGLESRLTDVMASEAAKARRIITNPEIKLGINVSPSMVGRLLDRLDLADLWQGVVIEITEHELIGDLEAVREALAEARHRGAMVYLDDFGTGFSSLSLLADLAIDGLKIDRHFVTTINETGSYEIVADIAEIGRRRGYPVVAEGIETVEQLQLVNGLGVELGQGYLFGRPMSLDALVDVASCGALPWSDSFARLAELTNWSEKLKADLSRPVPVSGAESSSIQSSSIQSSSMLATRVTAAPN